MVDYIHLYFSIKVGITVQAVIGVDFFLKFENSRGARKLAWDFSSILTIFQNCHFLCRLCSVFGVCGRSIQSACHE